MIREGADAILSSGTKYAGYDWQFVSNRSDKTKAVAFDWKNYIIKDDFAQRRLNAKKTVYKICDWTKKVLEDTNSALKIQIPAHDVVMLRLSK